MPNKWSWQVRTTLSLLLLLLWNSCVAFSYETSAFLAPKFIQADLYSTQQVAISTLFHSFCRLLEDERTKQQLYLSSAAAAQATASYLNSAAAAQQAGNYLNNPTSSANASAVRNFTHDRQHAAVAAAAAVQMHQRAAVAAVLGAPPPAAHGGGGPQFRPGKIVLYMRKLC